MSCLILPALWLGDLLGQNKLACILTWACRRCMVRYDDLGKLIIQEDGSAAPDVPPPRTEPDLSTVFFAILLVFSQLERGLA